MSSGKWRRFCLGLNVLTPLPNQDNNHQQPIPALTGHTVLRARRRSWRSRTLHDRMCKATIPVIKERIREMRDVTMEASNSRLNSHMAMKWCTQLDVAYKRCPIVFQGHASNFKVTRNKQIIDFPDCNFSLNALMAMQWCTNLEAA